MRRRKRGMQAVDGSMALGPIRFKCVCENAPIRRIAESVSFQARSGYRYSPALLHKTYEESSKLEPPPVSKTDRCWSRSFGHALLDTSESRTERSHHAMEILRVRKAAPIPELR